MSLFTLSFNNKEKKYIQLYNYIISLIEKGLLIENEKLPSKRSLADHLKISQNTIITAYELLLLEGYIISKPKSGYYVAKYEKLPNELHKIQYARSPGKKYVYDLVTSGIEVSSFPTKTWVKLTKEISFDEEAFRLGDNQGDFELRLSLAKYLNEYRGCLANPNNIIIGAGIEYLMSLLIPILPCKKGFAIENPGYLKIKKILENNNLFPQLIPVNMHGLDIKYLKEVNPSVVYVTPSHQFPVGTIMPIHAKTELIKWASDKYIIEDDYDSEFKYRGTPLKAIQGLNSERVIYLSTLSRILSPSLRIAYMILPNALLDVFKKRYENYSNTVSRIDQKILTKFIDEGYLNHHINRTRTLYKKKNDLFLSSIKSSFHNDCSVFGDAIGIHFTLSFKKPYDVKNFRFLLEKEGIKVSFISDYLLDNSIINDALIISYSSINLKDIPLVIEKIAEIYYRVF